MAHENEKLERETENRSREKNHGEREEVKLFTVISMKFPMATATYETRSRFWRGGNAAKYKTRSRFWRGGNSDAEDTTVVCLGLINHYHVTD
ncbi:hypothetical protein C5167_049725 [Papaver somniferum]|uniref:Uncharacterized protein n=1 Tax=Papaver somniferum TaxID=3469 RepID=A0A4Y7KQT0_PAPSO|nr:hypothetical protein C5167_049725 [Papaver somniferum]